MLKKSAGFWLANIALVSLLALTFACGKKETTDGGGGDEGPTTATPWTPKGDEGSITGKITLTGTPPAPQKIDMSQDANCATKNPNAVTETLVAKDGNLQYVFVYIKEGSLADGKKIADFSFKTPDAEVVLDQTGCQYAPHMLGMQPNQKLKVTNSDPTGHNIHALPAKDKGNDEWNESQPGGAPAINKTFKRSEILVPIKCNQHPWMKAYVGVVKHPFYAVSKSDGTFEIKGVPAGTYTLVAWQEKGGGGKGTEKTMTVTVPAKGAATADFAFDVAALALNTSNNSLEMMPAMDLPMLMRH